MVRSLSGKAVRRTSTVGVLLASIALSTPAAATAYVFDSVGDTYKLTFNGFGGDPVADIPGLTSTLDLVLTGGIGTKTLTFSYVLNNTSTAGGAGSRVAGFAFDLSPDPTSGSSTGAFTNLNLGGTYPDAIGKVEACLANNKGNGCSGSGGATLANPASGTISLNFNANTPSLTLSDFHVRYQSLSGLGKITSAAGNDVTAPVPEPDTWALMLIGFGAVGYAMRRRSTKGQRVRLAYT